MTECHGNGECFFLAEGGRASWKQDDKLCKQEPKCELKRCDKCQERHPAHYMDYHLSECIMNSPVVLVTCKCRKQVPFSELYTTHVPHCTSK